MNIIKSNEILFNDDEIFKVFNRDDIPKNKTDLNEIFYISSMYDIEFGNDKILALTGSITVKKIGRNSNSFKESVNLFKVIIRKQHINKCILDVLRGLYQLHRSLYIMDRLDNNDSLKIYDSDHKNITVGEFKYL